MCSAFGTGNNRFYLLTLKDDLDLAQTMPAENFPPGRSLRINPTFVIENTLASVESSG